MKRFRMEVEPESLYSAAYPVSVEDEDGSYVKYEDVLKILKKLSNHGHLNSEGLNVVLDWMEEN